MADDYSSDIGTTGEIQVGGSVSGVIEQEGDQDWFAADLEAGQIYRIRQNAEGDSETQLIDPYFRGVYDGQGLLVPNTTNDDSSSDLNSLVDIAVDVSGTYFFAAGAYAGDGSYTLQLEALDIRDDYTANSGTSGTISVGERSSSTLEFGGDSDWFAAELEAGQSYLIEITMTRDGSARDYNYYGPKLEGIFGADGMLVPGTEGYRNGAVSSNLFTPEVSGTYYISANSAFNYARWYDPGTYEISLSVHDLSSDIPGNTETTATLEIGGSQVSEIDFLGLNMPLDSDWFSVEVEAGNIYLFDLSDPEESEMPSNVAYLGPLWDENGDYIPWDEWSGSYYNADRLAFMPSESGRYFVSVEADYYSTTGSYELSAEELLHSSGVTRDQIFLAGDGYSRDITGSDGADYIIGSDVDNRLRGRGDADTLLGMDGDDLLIADDGFDPSWDPRLEEFVYRLFEFLLDRAPSERELQMGVELSGYSTWGFGSAVWFVLNSPEFQMRWGEFDNEGFITFFYERLRGEGADDDPGRQLWLDRLNDGWDEDYGYYYYYYDPSFVAESFIRSEEYQNVGTGYSLASRLEPSGANSADEIFSMYRAMLGRAPDEFGFSDWTDRMGDGLDLSGLAQRFARSAEFLAGHEDLSDRDFAELVLGNLGMDTGAAALDAAEALFTAGVSRADFAAAQVLLSDDAGVTAWMQGRGLDDVLDGGAGDDLLYGGANSDLFVFDPEGGSDTVVDLEPWDMLDLSGFGFEDEAAALAAFRQEQGGVMFEAEGTVVHFRTAELSMIDEDMFIL